MLTKMPTGIWKNFFILSPTLIYLKYPLKASEKKNSRLSIESSFRTWLIIYRRMECLRADGREWPISANWSVGLISHYVNHRASLATLCMIFEKFQHFRWIGSFINSLTPAPILPRRTKQPLKSKNNTVQK